MPRDDHFGEDEADSFGFSAGAVGDNEDAGFAKLLHDGDNNAIGGREGGRVMARVVRGVVGGGKGVA